VPTDATAGADRRTALRVERICSTLPTTPAPDSVAAPAGSNAEVQDEKRLAHPDVKPAGVVYQ
jgi:hypothetical protein